MPKKTENVPVNKEFSYWTVISESSRKGYWLCKCICGNIKEVRNDNLKDGKSSNCGCIKRKNWIKRNTKYFNNEIEDEPFYRRWQEMRNRVLSSRYPIYKNKNIKICERWLDYKKGFINFKNDMYESYIEHLKTHILNETTLDRIDNDGHYEPSNCRWASRKQQSQNSDRWINNVKR